MAGRGTKRGKQEPRIKNSRIKYQEGAKSVVVWDNGAARSFRDLAVWRRAHAFVLAVYRLTGEFPKSETYGLTLQLRRAAVSVPANIAEGFGRRGKLDKARFMNIAQGSMEECRYFLILAADLAYADTEDAQAILDEVGRMLKRYGYAILNS